MARKPRVGIPEREAAVVKLGRERDEAKGERDQREGSLDNEAPWLALRLWNLQVWSYA